MTYIKRLYIDGFKSFAKPLTLEFGNNYNVVIGPNGSGKSARGDTLVTLSDGSRVKIGDLVENNLKGRKLKKIDDGVYSINNDLNLKIISLNQENMRIEKKPI